MASFAASLLDELMGRNRNVNPNEKSKDIHWSDSEVCRYFLCGFCPHELFTNTRADLGPCSKIHDEELAKKYASSSRFLKMGYEEEFLRFLQDMIGEIDRKIRRGHQRLELNKSHTGSAGPIGIHQEKLKVLSDRITELVEQAEKLGCEGRVEEAQGVLKLCDQLKEERGQLQEIANSQMMPKEMEVCPVCGAFLVVGDAPQRVEEHVNGKQHVGYNKVRATIENLKKRLKGEDPEREARLQRERDERDKEKTVERERKDKGSDAEKKDRDSREKDRREKEPDKRDRKEDRNERSDSSRKRSKSRSRSRHGSKRSRSRSHDKHRRSRSHGKERRSRSGDRDRHHRSRDDKGSSSRHSYSSNGSDRRAGDRDRDRR